MLARRVNPELAGPIFRRPALYFSGSPLDFFHRLSQAQKIGKSKTLRPEKLGRFFNHPRRFFQRQSRKTFFGPCARCREIGGRIFET